MELDLSSSTSHVTWKKNLRGNNVLWWGRSGKCPEWRNPAGLSAVLKITQIRTNQYGGHLPHVDVENLNVYRAIEKLKFFFYLQLSIN